MCEQPLRYSSNACWVVQLPHTTPPSEAAFRISCCLYTMVSVCTRSVSGLALMTIYLFFPSSSLSLLLRFCAFPCKILEQPLQFLFPSLVPIILIMIFFYFRISYKVINAFQFYPILFFNLSNLS